MKSEHLKKVALALSEIRKNKMAKGGIAEGSEGDLDQEHERDLAELMIQGDQPPIANPKEMDAEAVLAKNLHEESEKEEYYASGGLVEKSDGDEMPAVDHSQANAAPKLSDEQKKAIELRKSKRRFMR